MAALTITLSAKPKKIQKGQVFLHKRQSCLPFIYGMIDSRLAAYLIINELP